MPRAQRVPSSLRLYLDKRGTPKGAYEINRTVSGEFTTGGSGFTIGATSSDAASFWFSPTQIAYNVSTASTFYPITNAAELSALFDRIKIAKVELEFHCTSPGLLSSGSGNPPLICFCTDDTDASATASFAN
jgi:hypothetical protein